MPPLYPTPLKNADFPIGRRFTKWTITGPPIAIKNTQGRYKVYYLCMCDCGWDKLVYVLSLLNGDSKSCGCLTRRGDFVRSHGMSQSALYGRWVGMVSRCTYASQRCYKNYGGRGIYVCDDWKIFANFQEWALSHGYEETLELDRIDNDGAYSPENCRYVSGGVNSQNKSSNVFITVGSETKHLQAWFVDPRCVISYASYYQRVRRGWLPKDALFTPRNKPNPRLSVNEVVF